MDDLMTLSSFALLAPAWQQCILLFLRQLYERSRSTGSVKTYLRVLVHFFASGLSPERYTRSAVELFISTSYTGTGMVSSNTRNSRLTVLSAFYTYAESYVIMDANG